MGKNLSYEALGAVDKVNNANRTNQGRKRNTGNQGLSADYQVKDTGYKRQLDAANARHVVPAAGKY